MDKEQFHKRNHYIPQMYLKNWSSDNKKIWQKKLLVSNENIPEWQKVSIDNTAYQTDLYSNAFLGDRIERMFDKSYEEPAKNPIEKLINGLRLTMQDWEKLIYFVGAQSLRTPARYFKSSERMKQILPQILEDTFQKLQCELEIYDKTGVVPSTHKCNVKSDILPIKVSIEDSEEKGKANLKTEMIISRANWLYEIEYIMNNTAKVLLNTKWSVIKPADDCEWITSDDPVICLNHYDEDKYDFGGGWGNIGSEIIFPISPMHLLYTQIGKRYESKWQADNRQTQLFNRLTIEHAFRRVYSSDTYKEKIKYRNRIVDVQQYKQEEEFFQNWGSIHDAIENEYYSYQKV